MPKRASRGPREPRTRSGEIQAQDLAAIEFNQGRKRTSLQRCRLPARAPGGRELVMAWWSHCPILALCPCLPCLTVSLSPSRPLNHTEPRTEPSALKCGCNVLIKSRPDQVQPRVTRRPLPVKRVTFALTALSSRISATSAPAHQRHGERGVHIRRNNARRQISTQLYCTWRTR